LRILKPILTLALVLALAVPSAVFAAEAKVHNWYFKPTENGKQPIVFGGDKMPDKYGAIYMGNPDQKLVYLTFDAGYGNENLDKILDTLKEQNVKATFFILPGLIKYALPTVMRMIEDGHLIANHSYSHKNMAAITDINTFKKELADLEDCYRDATGQELSPYFRPPEGAFTENTLAFAKELGYTTVFWSFAYADWDNGKQPDIAYAKSKILDNIHNGEVMLLHPNSAANAAVLGDVIATLKERGYDFRRVDEFASAASTQIDKYKDMGLLYADNPQKPDQIALSFDDGPHPTLTDEILDILKEHGVKATFFMIGENAAANPEIVKRVIAEGHEIGNHTYTHRKASELTEAQLRQEIEKTGALFKEQFSYTPVLFRPPAGELAANTVETVHSLGCTCVLWAWRVDTRDWASPPVKQVVNTVKNNVRGGDIVLFHDYIHAKSPTPAALKELLPYLKQRYSLVTVSTLLSDD